MPQEKQVLIETWRGHYNAMRPHLALGWQPSAPVVTITSRFHGHTSTVKPDGRGYRHPFTFRADLYWGAGHSST